MKTYTFGTGVTVEIQPISHFQVGKVVAAARAKFTNEHGEVKPPVYEITLPGGEVEAHEHDKVSVRESQFVSDEALRESWADYEQKRLQLQQLIAETNIKAWAWYGIKDHVPQEWLDEQAMFGIELPDDPAELKSQWVGSIATGFNDALRFAEAISAIDNPVEEAAAAAEETFRPALETSRGDDAKADSETAGTD